MFYIGFFVGWAIGILSALMLIYLVRRETESVADGERVCTNGKNVNDPFYVEVRTGKYEFRSDLIRKYGREEFSRMVSYGEYVHELRYQKTTNRRIGKGTKEWLKKKTRTR